MGVARIKGLTLGVKFETIPPHVNLNDFDRRCFCEDFS